jgi:predicted GNAT family acetyltransferase
MDVLATDDPHLVLERAASFLHAERFTANVMAVEVTGIAAGTRPKRPGSLWFLVEDGGAVVGAAMHTPPFPLNLPRLATTAVATLAGALFERQRVLSGVSGEAATVECFLAQWNRLGGADARQRVAMRFYVLDRLVPPTTVPGSSRLATEADALLLTEWVTAFHDEAQPDAPLENVGSRVGASIAHGRMWLWETERGPVATAGSPPPALGVARIGPVYTPPQHRRHGYGAAVTAAATTACLSEGADHVVLYTDLANPVSNSIYQSVGYRPDHDACEWDFV